MTWAIKFEDVSKRYRGGGRRRYPYLHHEVAQVVRRLFRGPGPDAGPRGTLALDHVTFDVEEGESYALVGPNGAGKTTALKLLTRISYPTGGRVRVRGRVAALIDVTAGIHPELTGRENIWLYGRILGMNRGAIARRFDEIVEFGDLARVLDTPVKMYSTGQGLRLGFSIASHLEPDIFVVDEALSVGDAAFQARCVDRMLRLVGEGRTLLFVSHHLAAIEAVCRRGVLLLGGRVTKTGPVRDVLGAYLEWVDTQQLAQIRQDAQRRLPSPVTIEEVTFHDRAGAARRAFQTGEDIEIRLRMRTDVPLVRPALTVAITDGRPGPLIMCSTGTNGGTPAVISGSVTVSCRLQRVPLMPQVYQTSCTVRDANGVAETMGWQMVGAFRIAEPAAGEPDGAGLNGGVGAPVHVDSRWTW